MLQRVKSQLKKIGLLRKAVRAFRKRKQAVYSSFARHAARYAVQSPFLSSLYYTFSGRFGREHRAVLYGRLKHLEEEDDLASARFLLRRSVHRLEKGLLMRPRRDIFALGYIERAVGAYEQVVRSRTRAAQGELAWARDVFDEYFSVVSSHPVVERAEARYRKCRHRHAVPSSGAANGRQKAVLEAGAIGKVENIEVLSGNKHCRRIPYRRKEEGGEPPVPYEAFRRLAQRRRSVRWFRQESVPRELIDKAVAIAAQSPSACNRLPYEFRIFDDPDLIAQLSEMPMGTKGYNHNIPVLAVIVGRQRAYFDERDRHLIYIDGSLAAMSFMYALETLGLSSCPINWPDIEKREEKMADFLDLAPDERPVMLIALGYPDPEGKVAYSQKKSIDDLRSFNE